MKKILLLALVVLTACSSPVMKKESSKGTAFIGEDVIKSCMDSVSSIHHVYDKAMLEKGIRHAASLWRAGDGSAADFSSFVKTNYIADAAKRKLIFNKISGYFESLNGNFNEITLDLKKVLDENIGKIDGIDEMFGSYSAGAHVSEDFYANKIAFYIALNFPYFTLDEKEKLGPGWTREEWAMARLGDLFTARVPAELDQALTTATGKAEMYIAGYNIYMGHLLTGEGKKIFPDDMVLLSHWNLRDELKSDYTDKANGPLKQDMIYKVMLHIINQDIPKVVINSGDYDWDPYSNKVTKGGNPADASPEGDARYARILDIFHAMKDIDEYSPEMNTAILRKFSVEMEISRDEVEALFDSYLSSPQLAKIASIIKERLGRDLKPYDIWYNGFKSRSSIPEELLSLKTEKLYPNPDAFHAAMPEMLKKLGWSAERAKYISDKIAVDPARGSGHAWGASMKGSLSHLRTRIGDKGMDYKGYNIAVHEFGHNVEQTISLNDVDYYMMAGVPNTAITEALAFVFQSRDLILLDMKDSNPDRQKLETLDAAWSLMEIMGVGMVDMKTWKWLYENPDATPAMLKENVIRIATETWNKYFAPVLGVKDSPVLAIYSHMVDSPLYLANYSYGQIVQFQLEEFLSGRNFSREIDRIFSQGKLTPQQWMQGAVGSKISTKPLINSLDKALE